MKLTPVFCTAIVGVGSRKHLQELKFSDIEGRGKSCTGRIEYNGEDEADRAQFEKLGESLTRAGGPLGVEIVIHHITRFLTRAEIKELAQQMADRLAA